MSTEGTYIAREGWVHLALSLVLAGGVHWFAGFLWAIPFWLLVLFVLQFFRNPRIDIPSEGGVVVSPAHGKVISITQVSDPYLKRPAKRISIFMNVFSIHANYSPVGGRVRKRWYHPGRFFNASLDKASAENERNALWIEDANGNDYVCVQVAGLIARRILCYVEKDDAVHRGQRYGFIRFGSRVDLYLPESCTVTARLGEWVRPGSDILATTHA